MTHKIFVYGSLMSERVLKVVLNRVPYHIGGELHGYFRFGVRGETYPAVWPKDGSTVNGLILHDITDLELERLDAFEDLDYSRQIKPIKLQSNDTMDAFVYIWNAPTSEMLAGSWSFDESFLPGESKFLKLCQRFVDNNYQWI